MICPRCSGFLLVKKSKQELLRWEGKEIAVDVPQTVCLGCNHIWTDVDAEEARRLAIRHACETRKEVREILNGIMAEGDAGYRYLHLLFHEKP